MQFLKHNIIWASTIVNGDCDWMKNEPFSKLIKSTSIAQNKRENCHPLDISFREISTPALSSHEWEWDWGCGIHCGCGGDISNAKKCMLWEIDFMTKHQIHVKRYYLDNSTFKLDLYIELFQNNFKRRWLHMTPCLSFGCPGSSCQVWWCFFLQINLCSVFHLCCYTCPPFVLNRHISDNLFFSKLCFMWFLARTMTDYT